MTKYIGTSLVYEPDIDYWVDNFPDLLGDEIQWNYEEEIEEHSTNKVQGLRIVSVEEMEQEDISRELLDNLELAIYASC